MSIEQTVKTYLQADGTLAAILTGGIYARDDNGATARMGITDQSTPDAFDDATGLLLPVAMITQLDDNPDGIVDDAEAGDRSAVAVLQVWVYEDAGYSNIDAAVERLRTLLDGHLFADGLVVEWAGSPFTRARDPGPLNGAPMARVDFAVYQIH